MKLLFCLGALLMSLAMSGQPAVKVEVSADTIAVGQIAEVTYTIENGKGDFRMPDLAGLPIISGPNTSSSFVYQNGQMKSSQSYSFRLRSREEGRMVIPPTTYQTGEEEIRIEPVEIVVVADRQVTGTPRTFEPAASSKSTREKKKF